MGCSVDDDEVVARPFAQPRGALRPGLDVFGVDAGDLGHAGVRIDGVEFEPTLGVQQVAQGGLVDDAGGFGFVVERLGVQRHELTVGAGLAVGDDDVGVQVRVAASGRFVLVGDGHQAGQPLQVLVAGDRVVHPGVAGVMVQILHRRFNRGGVCSGQDLLGDRRR